MAARDEIGAVASDQHERLVGTGKDHAGLELEQSREPALLEIRSVLDADEPFHGVQDRETRYRQRYLDLLVNEESRRDAEIRTRMVASIRRRLDAAGFVEVETPILQPRYGGGFAEPFVTHYNYLDQDYFLRIADELYLKRLIVGGLAQRPRSNP